MKKVLKNIVASLIIALIIFNLFGLIMDIVNKDGLNMQKYQYTKMLIGCLCIGIGFGLPAIIYDVESIPLSIKTIVHMGIGISTYIIVSIIVGWLPININIYGIITIVIGQFLISFFIWYLFMRYHRTLVKKMNERIKELNK